MKWKEELSTMAAQYAWMRQIREVQTWKQVRKRTTCFLEKLDQDIPMAILMRLAVAQQPVTRKQMNFVC